MPSIKIDCPSTYTDFGEIFSPQIKVDVRLNGGLYQSFHFILDSGADCTLVPLYMAELVGFRLPALSDAAVSGIMGTPMNAYKGRLQLRLSNQELIVRCLFTESNETAFLLGRVDFFSQYDIVFSGRNSHIELRHLV